MSVEHPAARPRNTVAVIGLLFAIVAVLVRVAASGIRILLPVLAQRSGGSVSQAALAFTVIGVVLLVLHLIAAALGLVAMLLQHRPRAIAGASLGVGAAGTVAAMADLLVPPLVGALLLALGGLVGPHDALDRHPPQPIEWP